LMLLVQLHLALQQLHTAACQLSTAANALACSTTGRRCRPYCSSVRATYSVRMVAGHLPVPEDQQLGLQAAGAVTASTAAVEGPAAAVVGRPYQAAGGADAGLPTLHVVSAVCGCAGSAASRCQQHLGGSRRVALKTLSCAVVEVLSR